MLTLYHGVRSVCSAKARIALEEKEIDYEGHVVNLYAGEQFDASYLLLNPMGVVPTLVDSKGPIVESSVIIQYVEDLSEQKRLMPHDRHDAALARRYLLRCLEIHAATNSLTFATAGRLRELKKTEAERDTYYSRMPDPSLAAKRKDLIDNGVESSFVDAAIYSFATLFHDLEHDLFEHGGDWIVGEFSLADIALIAYVDRLDRLGLSGFWSSSLPRTTRWLERFKQRPSYASQIQRFNAAPHVPDPYQQKVGHQAWPVISSKLQLIAKRRRG